MFERDVQSRCVRFARLSGVIAHKFSSESHRSVPDYLFLYRGMSYFVEFKAPGKRATKAQLREHRKLRGQGFFVSVVDDVDAGKQDMAFWLSMLS